MCQGYGLNSFDVKSYETMSRFPSAGLCLCTQLHVSQSSMNHCHDCLSAIAPGQPLRLINNGILVILSVRCAVHQVGASGALDRSVHLRRVPTVVPARCAGTVCQHRLGRAYVYQHFYEVRQPAGVAGSLQHFPGHQLSSGLLVLVERPHAVCTPAQSDNP